ncbi:phosphate ABC transporter substrate-binding protein PstS [Bifidobacterium canis]|uniref:Phosphate-binding protein n=1 Tax=Bifidobacterium canis TaxID=2610880 RepID=A0A7K1J4W7_9BIFI|nr:phosphate ABC transporter substrate-binding protein PstS [Bifidobacterium canis]MUH59632.1 phosphate ABC transporter substrate-binding protein [Bifidobacterium canis]
MRSNTVQRLIAFAVSIAMLTGLAACGNNAAVDDGTIAAPAVADLSGSFAGAGASSQQAAVEAWISGFQRNNGDTTISYNPSGSGAGVITFLTGATAWAGSDKPLSDSEVQESKSVCADGTTAFDVPVYIAPIAIAYRLDGFEDQHINMSPQTIAKVFDGKITQWNDAEIAAENPNLQLPDTPITVVHRSDKSGTTLNFVKYLYAAANDAWPYDPSENWPNDVGQGAKGTSGVVSTIDQANGTIGYADYSQAASMGTIAVKVGDTYTQISAEAGSKAIADSSVEKTSGDNRVVVDVNYTTQSEGAYPIVLLSYNIVCPVYKNAMTSKFAKAWMSYVTSEDGQETAQQATGSSPLPTELSTRIKQSVDAMSDGQ